MPIPSDLPPGVSVNMIPGNRPEDLEDEKFWEELFKQFETAGITIPEEFQDEEWFVRAIVIARDMGIVEGVNEEKTNQDLERMMQHGS